MSSETFPVQKKLCNVLTQLMSECDIDDGSLSKQTGIPSSTIARLRSNADSNPTAQTLRPLAKFFDINIGQLLGDEPFPKDRIPGTFNPQEFTTARIPIVKWEWINTWENEIRSPSSRNITWISTEKRVSDKSFALIVDTDSLGLAFRKGSILIIDQNKSVIDGDLVLIKLSGEEDIVLKRLLKDGSDYYIKSVNPELSGIKQLTSGYQIYGAVIECRFSTISTPSQMSIVAETPVSISDILTEFHFKKV